MCWNRANRMLIALLFALINFNIFCVATGIPAGDSLASLPIVAENAFKSIHHAETTLIKPNLNSMEAHLRSLCKRAPGNCDFTNLPELARENVYYQSILNSHSHPKDILNLMRTNDDLAKRVLSETDPRFRSKMSAVVQLASETGLDARENARNTHVLNLIYDQPNLVKWASSEGDDYLFTLDQFKSLEFDMLGHGARRSETERYIHYVLSHDHFLADADRQFFVVRFIDYAALFSNVPLMKGLLGRHSWSSHLSGNDLSKILEATHLGVTDRLVQILLKDPFLESKLNHVDFEQLWLLAFERVDLRTIDLLVTVPESRFSGESIADQFKGFEEVAVYKHFIENKDFLMRIPPGSLQNLIWNVGPELSDPILTALFKHNQYLLRVHDRFLQDTFIGVLSSDPIPNNLEQFFRYPGFLDSLSDHDWRVIIHTQVFPTMTQTFLENPAAKAKIALSLRTNFDPAGLYGFMTSDMNFAREMLLFETPVMEQQLKHILHHNLPSPMITGFHKPFFLLEADRSLLVLLIQKVARTRFTHSLSADVLQSIDVIFANDRPDLSNFLVEMPSVREIISLHRIPQLIQSIILTDKDLGDQVINNRVWVELFNDYAGKRLMTRIFEGSIPVDTILARPNLLSALDSDLIIQNILENQGKSEHIISIRRLANNEIVTQKISARIKSRPPLSFDTIYSLMKLNSRLISTYAQVLPYTSNAQDLAPIIDRVSSNVLSATHDLDRQIVSAYFLSDSVSVDQMTQTISRQDVSLEWLEYLEIMIDDRVASMMHVPVAPEEQQLVAQKLKLLRQILSQKWQQQS